MQRFLTKQDIDELMVGILGSIYDFYSKNEILYINRYVAVAALVGCVCQICESLDETKEENAERIIKLINTFYEE